MATLDDRLNGDNPPAVLDAIDVEFLGVCRGSLSAGTSQAGLPPVKVNQLSWTRPDGQTLFYYRWQDEDGERFYSADEFERRAI